MAGFAAHLNDAESRRIAREFDPQCVVQRGTVRSATSAYVDEGTPDVLLVDLDGVPNPLSAMSALLGVCRPATVTLATGSENNVILANDLYRVGVFLYFPKPLNVTDLRRTIEEVEAARAEVNRPVVQTNSVVVVHGKGMGANTVTTLLARFAAEHGRYVTCLDLDADFGTLALALNTTPARGLSQALAGSGFDRNMIDAVQARVSDRIGLIAHPLDQVGLSSAVGAGQALADLVAAACSQAHLVLICGASLADLESLRHLTTSHVVVFEPTPSGVSVAMRWMRIVDGGPTALILNHTRPLPGLVGREQIRTSLGGRQPDATLPYNKSMARAMVLGEPETAVSRREREMLYRVLRPLVGLAGTDQGAATPVDELANAEDSKMQ